MYTEGMAGTGKTTIIVQDVQPGDMVICMTQGAKNAIIKKKRSIRDQVYTVESANLWAKNKKIETLFIDECTLIDPISVIDLIKSCQKLRLFGDPS